MPHMIPSATCVKQKWMDVSPKTAEAWLEGNVHNRKLRQNVVNRYARAMLRGQWGQHHQGIAFSTVVTMNGVTGPMLIDGQHRLWAIIESGVTVSLQVNYGMDPDSQQFIDDHERRTTVDVYGLEREDRKCSTLHAAMAKMIWRRGRRTRTIEKATRQEEMVLIDKHWAAITFCLDAISNARTRYLTPASVLTECARAWYAEDRTKIAEFLGQLTTGANMGVRSPVLHLRNQLLQQGNPTRSGRRSGLKMGSDEQADRTAIALRVFLDGGTMTKLILRTPPRFKTPGDERQRKGDS